MPDGPRSNKMKKLKNNLKRHNNKRDTGMDQIVKMFQVKTLTEIFRFKNGPVLAELIFRHLNDEDFVKISNVLRSSLG